jgi:hypothetical protein
MSKQIVPISKLRQLHETWRSMQKNQLAMENTVISLMRHPDATDEQILTAARAVRDLQASMVETCKHLQEALLTGGHGGFPRPGVPWQIEFKQPYERK